MSNPIIDIDFRARKGYPCEVCGKESSCSRTRRGCYFCISYHEHRPNFFYHGDDRNGVFGIFEKVHDDGKCATVKNSPSSTNTNTPKKIRVRPTEVPSGFACDWNDYLGRHPVNREEVERLADQLGVHPDSLVQLGMGWVPESESETRPGEVMPEHFLFPERDGDGNVIGILRRIWPTGEKLRIRCSRNGLTYDLAEIRSMKPGDTLLIVEGASDVAAAKTVGICAVGRPSNRGGSELLADLIRQHVASGVEWIVVGENDQKKDGLWPGKEGAEFVTQRLAELLGLKEGTWSLPPVGVKDLRSWTNQTNAGRRSEGEVRRVIIEGLIIRSSKHYVPDFLLYRATPNLLENSAIRKSGTFFYSSYEYSRWDTLSKPIQDILFAGTDRRPCPIAHTFHLQHKTIPLSCVSRQVDCKQWMCVACGPRRRAVWLAHLMQIYRVQANLYVAIVAEERWDAIRKQIKRSGGEHAVIHQASGQITVIANCDFAEGRRVEPGEASEATAIAIQNLRPGKGKHIHTSYNWQLDDEEPKSDYRRRGASPDGTLPLVHKKLRKDDMNPREFVSRRGKGINWQFPPDMTTQQQDMYFDDLSALSDSPPPGSDPNSEPPDINPFIDERPIPD